MEIMNSFIDWRIFCSVMAVAALVAFGLHTWFHLNFWLCFVLVVVAIKINGMIATIEDEKPGGFLNPKLNEHKDETK
jgi:hypothetical protein